jgi:hypothetical protein
LRNKIQQKASERRSITNERLNAVVENAKAERVDRTTLVNNSNKMLEETKAQFEALAPLRNHMASALTRIEELAALKVELLRLQLARERQQQPNTHS